jgi:hypothetical protein
VPTLDATVGGANSNSYVTVATADTYFDERLNVSAWTDLTASAADVDTKEQALIQATRRIDQEDFDGSPVNPLTGTSTDTTQALKFPRFNATNEEGWDYLQTVIPDPVQRATMELALSYIGTTDDGLADSGLEGFEDVKLGPISVTPKHSRSPIALPDVVRDLLTPLLGDGSSRFQFTINRA